MKKYFWLIFSLFFLSRLFFLANYPHFYNSPEYYRESLFTNFWQSIAASHQSVHPLYLFLTQIFQKVSFSLIGQPQIWVVSLISAVFGIIGILAWYFLVKRIFGDRLALFSLVPLIFFPHLWLIQTNILHKTIEQGLFLLGLLFLDVFLEKRKIYFWDIQKRMTMIWPSWQLFFARAILMLLRLNSSGMIKGIKVFLPKAV